MEVEQDMNLKMEELKELKIIPQHLQHGWKLAGILIMTLVVAMAGGIRERLTGGRATVAVRAPDHPAPMKLIAGLGGPITGTSANISGGADPSTMAELSNQIGGRIDVFFNEGPAPKGTASTVVDITTGQLKLLREGAIPFEQVLRTWERAT